MNESEIQGKLAVMLDEKNELAKKIEDLEKDITLKTNENIEEEELCKVLGEQISSVKLMLEDTNMNESELQSELAVMFDENNELVKKIEDLEKGMTLKTIENVEKSELCKELSEQISYVKEKLEETNMNESELQGKLAVMFDEKNELVKKIEDLEKEIALKTNENIVKEELCNVLSEQISSVKFKFEDTNMNESELQSKLKVMLDEKNEFVCIIDQLENDKLDLIKIIQQLKENLKINREQQGLCDILSQELVSVKLKLEETVLNKSNVESNLLNLQHDRSTEDTKISLLESQLMEKDKVLQRLEKSNLLLKAKSLKIKKQYDEKRATFVTCDRNDSFSSPTNIIEKREFVDKSIQSSGLLENLTISHISSISVDSNSNIYKDDTVGADEMSFMSRIQSLSDDVDHRARKANLEIEAFLERNEQVTSCLSTDVSSSRKNLCDNAVCQRQSVRIRELSTTIENMQQQNELMKNKIIDLQYCMEYEQETRKQISQEGLQVHDNLVKKLNDSLQSNCQLKLDFVANQELLAQKKNSLNSLSSKFNECKERCDRLSVLFTEKETELQIVTQQANDLKKNLEDNEHCVFLLKEQLKKFTDVNSKLKKDNENVYDELENRRLINQEDCQVHDHLIKEMNELSCSRDQLKQELAAYRELLVEKTNLLNCMSTELSHCKELCEQQQILLSDRGNEFTVMTTQNNEVMQRIKDDENYILRLEEKLTEISEANCSLKERHDKVCDFVNGINQEIEFILTSHDSSFQSRSPFFEKKNDVFSCLEILNDNVKLLELIKKTNDGDETFNESIESFVETVVNTLSDCITDKDAADKQLRGLLENNNVIENHLSMAVKRLDIITENCLIKNNEIQGSVFREFGMDENYQTERSINTEEVNEVEIIAVKCDKDEAVASQLEICVSLKNEIVNLETDLLQIIQSNTNFKYPEAAIEFSNNPCSRMRYFINVIKSLLNDRSKLISMVDGNVQTFSDSSHFKRIDDLVAIVISELPNQEDLPRISGLDSMELWANIIVEMKHEMALLKDEIAFQAQEKNEISERFEKLFIELERSCDNEIDELKGTNGRLNREIERLHSERDVRESSMRDYEIQISYFKSLLEIPKEETCIMKNETVDLSSSENSQFWFSEQNDALKETISEKEDHITELMDQINDFNNRFKESVVKNEEYISKISQLESELSNLQINIKVKEKNILENNAVINELEAVCVEKENRINLLEKESSEINLQLEQYITAVCSMQARLEASKPNLELILNKIENKDNNVQLLNLIDQLEKDYADELELAELNKSKIEIKLNKAVQMIHKLKKQLKESHNNEISLVEKLRSTKSDCQCDRQSGVLKASQSSITNQKYDSSILRDVSIQIDDDEIKLLRDENQNYKGIIENLHVNNFLLWKELDSVKKTDRNIRGSSLPLMNNSGNSVPVESERSTSPISQLSWNSGDVNSSSANQIKDLQRKLQRVHQQLNQMRIERNRIHQEYSRIRQLKEVADNKINELLKKIDTSEDQGDILTEKNELIKSNNQYSTQIVELQSEIEMMKVRNSILETKSKKIEMKLTSQRRKYDQMVLKLDEKEQELDRWSDESRRNVSNFEKDKITWLREKKELKTLLASKEEKIANLRKRLLNKTSDVDNCDSDYLIEINQLQGQLNELKSLNKQFSTRHREQLSKFQGQIEELIDDNRQLKRKLSLGHIDGNIIGIVESQKNVVPLMKVIEEDTEDSSYSGTNNSIEMNTMLANVVLEKEQLLSEISNLRCFLDIEKDKCLGKNNSKIVQHNKSSQTLDNISMVDASSGCDESLCMVDKSQEITPDSQTISCQTWEYRQYIDCGSQTGSEFEDHCYQLFRDSQLGRNVDQSLQIDLCDSRSTQTKVTEIQTDPVVVSEYLRQSKKQCSNDINCQTDEDGIVVKLQNDLNKKSNLIEQNRRQFSKQEHQLIKLKNEFNDLLTNYGLMESKNFEYQEIISMLELEQIDRDKKCGQDILNLNLQITQLKEQISKVGITHMEVYDKADQTLLCQPSDEGWDMEWDYEKLKIEHHPRNVIDDGIVNNLESSAETDQHQLDDLIMENAYCREQFVSGSARENVIAILRDEIVTLKSTIGEKNSEIGQLKGLRNQLQTDLLESGQQIKDSNMEFLNLKENIQVLHAERDILRQTVDDLEGYLNEMVNFTEMISFDLRRLRDCSDDLVDQFVEKKNFDANRVKMAVQLLEHELHRLLEHFQSKDMKLESAFSQIEQLSCTIHRLQLQQGQSNEHHTMITEQSHNIDSTNSTNNIHDDCVSTVNQLSELLEKKHSEIEELKSRLFLATDQLIHFRTFFANTDNQLHKELLLITRHHSLEFRDKDTRQCRDHTKVLLDSDDQSDSDQSLVSHDGNTVIRVERTRTTSNSKSVPNCFWLLNRVIGSIQNKKIMTKFKRVFSIGRRQLLSFRSQPRINIRALLLVYLAVLHLMLIRCLLL